MLIVLGQLSLYLALLAALVAGAAFVLAAVRRDRTAASAARDALTVTAGLLAAATAILVSALISGDFAFRYVAHYTSTALPVAFRVSALWAGPEGSLLVWATMAAIVAAAVVRSAPPSRRQCVAGAALAAMLALLLLVLNINPDALATGHWPLRATPFLAAKAVPADGAGLNMQLQTWAMIAHPPALLLAYALLAPPFALGVAELLLGRQSPGGTVAPGRDALPLARRFLVAGWIALTAGNALGAWWAYTELGWGGYWAWDPVENASLVPWLLATAAIHTAATASRADRLRGPTWWLAIATFLACIMATYITRSGLAVSVHAYVARSGDGGWAAWVFRHCYGLFIAGTVLTVVLLAAVRWIADRPTSPAPAPAPRRTDRLVVAPHVATVLVLAVFAAAVLAGTLAPGIVSAVSGHEVTMSEDEFNRLGAVFGLLLLIALGACAAVAILRRFATLPAALGHAAFVLMAVAIVGSHLVNEEQAGELAIDESTELLGRRVTLLRVDHDIDRAAGHLLATARLAVAHGGKTIELAPALRVDPHTEQRRGEVAVRVGLLTDLYASLDGYDPHERTVQITLRRRGLMLWLWTAMAMLTLSGVAALARMLIVRGEGAKP